MKTSFLVLACLLALAGRAAHDRPEVTGLTASTYLDGGWYAYRAASYADDGSLKFSDSAPFLLSPRYAAPICRVVVRLAARTGDPTRRLQLAPYVGGREQDPVALDGRSGVAVVSFAPEDRVEAVRLFLPSAGAGTWSVAEICAFYGEQTADDLAALRSFAEPLAAPAGLRVTEFTSGSFALAADAVEGASGYRFRIEAREGTPLTEIREDFDGAPNASAGWVLSSENAILDRYESAEFADSRVSPSAALKIEPEKGAEGTVRVALTSPRTPAAISSVSFMLKSRAPRDTVGVSLYARASEETGWERLSVNYLSSSEKFFVTNTVPFERGFRQIRLQLEGEGDAFESSTYAIDSVCATCGGDVHFVPLEDGGQILPSPAFAAKGVPTGVYVACVQAVGGSSGGVEFADSAWSDRLTFDLAAEEGTDPGPEAALVPLSSLDDLAYAQDFSVLASVSGKTDVGDLGLAGWQFFEGTDPVTQVLYSEKATATTGGIYVLPDEDEDGNAIRTLGSLSTTDRGFAFGIAFSNDTGRAVSLDGLSFNAIQRTFKTRSNGYVLEAAVTDGAWGLSSAAAWRKLDLPSTGPETSETHASGVAVRMPLAPDVSAVDEIAPGRVLLLRWSHPAVGSGPMMAIGDLKVRFASVGGSVLMIFR